AGVVERGEGLGLVAEAAQLGVVGEDPGLDHLQGDGPVEAELSGAVDDAHAAAAQLALDLVVAAIAQHGPTGQGSGGVVGVEGAGRTTCVAGRGAAGVGPGWGGPGDVGPSRFVVLGRRLGNARPGRGGLTGRARLDRAPWAGSRRRAWWQLGAAGGAAAR